MRTLWIFLGCFLVFGQAHAGWVPVATVNEKTPGHLCDVDDNGLDLFCGATNPEILANGTISATNLSIGNTISTSSLFVNGQAITGATQTSGTSSIEWGYKDGPVSYDSNYINTWDTGSNVGPSIDCTSNTNGCIIQADGTYDIVCEQRKNANSSIGYIAIALNGNRAALENLSGALWSQDHAADYLTFSSARYTGALNSGDLITCGPVSANASEMEYGALGFNGYMLVKRLDGFATPDADNLGSHVASQTLNLNGNWLSGDGDAEGVFVDGNGRVGIGTSSPNAQLDIEAASGTAFVEIHAGSGSNARLRFADGGSLKWNVGLTASNDSFNFFDQGTLVSPVVFEQGAPLHSLFLENTGNVGIGISTPENYTGYASTTTLEVGNPAKQGVLALTGAAGTGNVNGTISFQTGNAERARIDTFVENGTNNRGELRFYTRANGDPTVQERMRVDSSGRVGIGTSSPNAPLHTHSPSSNALTIGTAGDDTSDQSTLNLLTSSNGTNGIGSSGASGWHIYARGSSFTGNTNNLGITYWNGSSYLPNPVIAFEHDTGNVGIGTNSPNARLELSDTNSTQLRVTSENAGEPHVYFKRSGGAASWRTGIINTDPDFTISKYSGSDVLDFHAIYIDHGSYVGIGDSTPDYKLDVNGTAYATGAAGALSDRRHKKAIKDLPVKGLETVTKLRPVQFKWKDPLDAGMEGAQFGFIAQEVEEVLPQIILTQDDEEQTKGMKPTALIPVLTKAIQEQNAEIKALKEKLVAERGRNAAQNARLKALEAAMRQ